MAGCRMHSYPAHSSDEHLGSVHPKRRQGSPLPYGINTLSTHSGPSLKEQP